MADCSAEPTITTHFVRFYVNNSLTLSRSLLSTQSSISSPVHQIDKAIEQIMAVARARRCFRMVLHREHRPVLQRNAAVRAVKQRDMGFHGARGQACAVD